MKREQAHSIFAGNTSGLEKEHEKSKRIGFTKVYSSSLKSAQKMRSLFYLANYNLKKGLVHRLHAAEKYK